MLRCSNCWLLLIYLERTDLVDHSLTDERGCIDTFVPCSPGVGSWTQRRCWLYLAVLSGLACALVSLGGKVSSICHCPWIPLTLVRLILHCPPPLPVDGLHFRVIDRRNTPSRPTSLPSGGAVIVPMIVDDSILRGRNRQGTTARRPASRPSWATLSVKQMPSPSLFHICTLESTKKAAYLRTDVWRVMLTEIALTMVSHCAFQPLMDGWRFFAE